MERAVEGLRYAVEKHPLYADVIVKIFCVPHGGERATGMQVQQGRTVRRHRQTPRFTKCPNFEKAANPAATRCVRHNHVDSARFDHLTKV